MIRLREGRWALSRIVTEASGFPVGFTTAAMRDRLAQRMEAYYPPMNDARTGYALGFAVVRLQGGIQQPANDDTRLIPNALLDATLRDLTVLQRQRLRAEIEEWFTGYQFTDYDGAVKVKAAFSAAGYTLDTPIRRILLDLFEHMGHSESRPRVIVPESHNTEYLDDFSTDPFSAPRWTNEIGGSAWDSANNELDCDNGTGQPWGVRYSINGPGSVEHEAQVTSINGSDASVCGGAACRFDTGGADDWYLLWIQDWSNQNLIWLSRMNAGTRTDLTSYAFTVANNDWFTHRMAVSGAAGATAVIDTWITNHGATKPSDPGWYGTDGTPDQTYSDTSASRLDDATHGHCGISGRTGGVNFDTRHCFWKSRAISDRGGGGTTYTKTMSDACAVSDGQYLGRERGKHFSEAALSVGDGQFISRERGRFMTDAVSAVIDGQFLSRERGRLMGDVLTAADEQALFRLRQRTHDDPIVVTDQTLVTRYVFRVLDDFITLLDTFTKLLAGEGVTYTITLSDAVTVADELLAHRLRSRQLSDTITLTDGTILTRERLRHLSDALSITDSQLHFLLRTVIASEQVSVTDDALFFRMRLRDLVDAFSVIDSFSATITGVVVPVTVEVRVRLGYVDPVELGQDAPIRLGADDAIKLGGYN